jgi:hypothetical protein
MMLTRNDFIFELLILSVINFRWWSFPYHLYPLLLDWAHVFAFPFDFCLICRGWGSDLADLFFVWAQVRKTSVTPKTIFYTLLSWIFFISQLKWRVRLIDRCVCARRRYFGLSFLNNLLPLTVFFRPIFPISFTFI